MPASSRETTWRPVRLLDHLRCIRGRNLLLPSSHIDDVGYSFELFAIQSDGTAEDSQQSQQRLYTSEQIQSTCNPDWAAIAWPDAVQAQLRTISTVTLHLFAAVSSQHHSKRPAPGQIAHGTHQRHDTASESLHHALGAPDALRPDQPVASESQQYASHPDSEGSLAEVDSDTSSIPDAEALSETASMRDTASTPLPQSAAGVDASADDQADLTPGSQAHFVQATSRPMLILTADINLNELHVFQRDLASLNVSLPPNTLVLELTDGLSLFSSLDIGTAASDSAQLSNASGSMLDLPGSVSTQDLTAAARLAPATSSMSEQSARQQLAESLLNRPAQQTSAAASVTSHNTPEVGRLRGLVKAKLGFAFAGGSDLAGLNSPHGVLPEQQARLASSQQASSSGRAQKAPKVDLSKLDKEMVALMHKQQQLQAALSRKEDLCKQLTEALDHHNTARQQHLRLDALRHGREQHRQRAAHCQKCIHGAARSQDLSHTILRAQLQSLQHALQTLKAAKRRLDSADVMVKGPEGAMRWRPLHAHLVSRRCHMATLLAKLYAVGPQTVTVCQAPPNGFLEDQLERGWWAGSDAGSSCSGSPRALIVTRRKQAGSAAKNGFRQAALLTIGGVDLDPLLGRGGLNSIMNWEGDRQDMRKAAAALGYLAAAVERLGFYLDVPLRYPIRLGNCKSLILSHADSAGTYRLPDSDKPAPVTHVSSAFGRDGAAGIEAYPLFCEGVDRGRFAYGIYLLNKDVEQLLNAHGLTGTGASQVLANLHKLLAAAASA